jgi:hypothetical protein
MRAMKAVSTTAVLLLLAVNAFMALVAVNAFSLPQALGPQALGVVALPPAASAVLPYVLGATLVLGLVALVTILAGGPPRRANERVVTAEAARPMPAPAKESQAEVDVISFLATLQAKGRLVDFLMDNISAYSDAQVGAAARVVHTGCRAVLQEQFQIRPIRDEGENSKVEVPADYPADEYRLLGKVGGQAPFSGVLVHHGWKTDYVKLPTILRGSVGRLPAIAPAEVELK